MQKTRGARYVVAVLSFCAALALAANSVCAADFWLTKPPEQWSLEEALSLLTDSPWAKQVIVSHPTGRLLESKSQETRTYVTGQGKPRYRSVVTKGQSQVEYVEARYTVRWSSARVLKQASHRLREVAPQATADLYAPPPGQGPESVVVTVHVSQPPAAPMAHLFQGLPEEALLDGAELRTDRKEIVKPAGVIRHGLGAGESVSFYFPREQAAFPAPATDSGRLEFVFRGREGVVLKARFDRAALAGQD